MPWIPNLIYGFQNRIESSMPQKKYQKNWHFYPRYELPILNKNREVSFLSSYHNISFFRRGLPEQKLISPEMVSISRILPASLRLSP